MSKEKKILMTNAVAPANPNAKWPCKYIFARLIKEREERQKAAQNTKQGT